jgi:DNA-binding transcriptional regulator YiaG
LTDGPNCVTNGNEMNKSQFTKIRKRMKLTQAELARELGVSRAAVSRWESGERRIDNILALALECLVGRRAGKKRRGHAKSRK